VLKTRKDSDSHPPSLPGGAYRFAPDPTDKKQIPIVQKITLYERLTRQLCKPCWWLFRPIAGFPA